MYRMPTWIRGKAETRRKASLVANSTRLPVSATAKAAQETPDDYKDLLVRMAGYSDYFNDMNADLQQEVIERTENESF